MLEKPKLSIVLEKDNLIVYLSIFLIVIITGLYTIFGIGMPMSAIEMTKMSGIFSMSSSMEMNMNMGSNNMDMNMGSNNMDMKNRWSISMAISMFLMWWLMMIAMMTPSAAPTLLLFHNLKKSRSDGHFLRLSFILLSFLCVNSKSSTLPVRVNPFLLLVPSIHLSTDFNSSMIDDTSN